VTPSHRTYPAKSFILATAAGVAVGTADTFVFPPATGSAWLATVAAWGTVVGVPTYAFRIRRAVRRGINLPSLSESLSHLLGPDRPPVRDAPEVE